ncbi:hypothetical protein OG195_44730 (plasmid) [Streptomyces sp. NBC_01362]|uniref:hypothetical protein n=1 Tax=Streptomyces sp. NBC_01362 TaxID=2903839 RepID=UPI002E37E370|nr:hypothetical protein [Streptomyces sp. NBC_01362]
MSTHLLGVEIACDGPAGRDNCPHNAAIRAQFTSRTARQVRADGRRDGWTVHRIPGRLLDICPRCRNHTTEGPTL